MSCSVVSLLDGGIGTRGSSIRVRIASYSIYGL
jgi:hypothetical protein